MRHPAGELADRLHLLRSAQHRLRPFAFDHLVAQRFVSACDIQGSLGHQFGEPSRALLHHENQQAGHQGQRDAADQRQDRQAAAERGGLAWRVAEDETPGNSIHRKCLFDLDSGRRAERHIGCDKTLAPEICRKRRTRWLPWRVGKEVDVSDQRRRVADRGIKYARQRKRRPDDAAEAYLAIGRCVRNTAARIERHINDYKELGRFAQNQPDRRRPSRTARIARALERLSVGRLDGQDVEADRYRPIVKRDVIEERQIFFAPCRRAILSAFA